MPEVRELLREGAGLEPSFPGSFANKDLHLPLTQRRRVGRKTLSQYWEKFRIHFEFLNKEF